MIVYLIWISLRVINRNKLLFIVIMNNNNKNLKPNLLDPLVEKKIIKTLKPIQPDYWAPAKNSAQSFMDNIIKPNISLLIFILIIIIFLIYRYRITKKKRELEQNENTYHLSKNSHPIKSSEYPKQILNDTTNTLLQLYNQQKDFLREPPINNIDTKRMTPVRVETPKLAYPMYPYGSNGTLLPANSR